MSAGSRRRREWRQELPGVASLLARSVHAGASLPTALHDAAASSTGPVASELRSVCDALARGVGVGEALEQWARSCPGDEVELLVSAATVGHEHGGRLGPALDGVALTLHDRLEVADEASALSSQARTSAMVLVALPPFGAACFVLLDPSLVRTFVATPLGWACIVVGLGLDLAAAEIMRRMVERAVPA